MKLSDLNRLKIATIYRAPRAVMETFNTSDAHARSPLHLLPSTLKKRQRDHANDDDDGTTAIADSAFDSVKPDPSPPPVPNKRQCFVDLSMIDDEVPLPNLGITAQDGASAFAILKCEYQLVVSTILEQFSEKLEPQRYRCIHDIRQTLPDHLERKAIKDFWMLRDRSEWQKLFDDGRQELATTAKHYVALLGGIKRPDDLARFNALATMAEGRVDKFKKAMARRDSIMADLRTLYKNSSVFGEVKKKPASRLQG